MTLKRVAKMYQPPGPKLEQSVLLVGAMKAFALSAYKPQDGPA